MNIIFVSIFWEFKLLLFILLDFIENIGITLQNTENIFEYLFKLSYSGLFLCVRCVKTSKDELTK